MLLHPFKEEYMAERSLLLAEAIIDYDVVCLNEAFQFGSNIVAKFVEAARKRGFKYAVSGRRIPITARLLLDSGVLIVSKYPIIRTDVLQYEQSCSYDAFAAKSAVYAEISIGRRSVHLFSTHLQASDGVVTPTEVDVRVNQSAELHNFIEKYAIGADRADPILLLGDMNIDSIGRPEEYKRLVRTLSISGFDFIDTTKTLGHPPTLGEIVEGSTMPAEPYLTLKVDWGRPQAVDYIFIYNRLDSKPVFGFRPSIEKFSVSGKLYKHLSDHSGVKCVINLRLLK
jgi:endonuclease/exonuclease/phosphatase family metal-dependent hydrolase